MIHDSSPATFEERLLGELKTEMKAEAEPRAVKATRRPHLALVAAAAVVAAAVSIAVPLAESTHSAAKAFTVSETANGMVTVRIVRFQDASGLERALLTHGVRADITYLPRDKKCQQPRYVRSKQASGLMDLDTSHGLELTFSPRVAATDTWVLEYTGHQIKPGGPLTGSGPGGSGSLFYGSFGVTRGAVAPCVLVPFRQR